MSERQRGKAGRWRSLAHRCSGGRGCLRIGNNVLFVCKGCISARGPPHLTKPMLKIPVRTLVNFPTGLLETSRLAQFLEFSFRNLLVGSEKSGSNMHPVDQHLSAVSAHVSIRQHTKFLGGICQS